MHRLPKTNISENDSKALKKTIQKKDLQEKFGRKYQLMLINVITILLPFMVMTVKKYNNFSC